MVRFGLSTSHQFISHMQRKRNVNEAVAVNVANFAAAHAEFRAAKAMRRVFDFFPARNSFVDLLPSTFIGMISLPGQTTGF